MDVEKFGDKRVIGNPCIVGVSIFWISFPTEVGVLSLVFPCRSQ